MSCGRSGNARSVAEGSRHMTLRREVTGGHAAPHHIDRQRQAERQHGLVNAWESLGVEPNAEQSRQRGRGGPQCPAAVPAQPLTRGFVPAGFKTCQESCRRPSCRRTQSTSRCDSLASTHRKLLSQQRRASGDLLAVGDAESCGSPRHTQPATRRTRGRSRARRAAPRR